MAAVQAQLPSASALFQRLEGHLGAWRWPIRRTSIFINSQKAVRERERETHTHIYIEIDIYIYIIYIYIHIYTYIYIYIYICTCVYIYMCVCILENIISRLMIQFLVLESVLFEYVFNCWCISLWFGHCWIPGLWVRFAEQPAAGQCNGAGMGNSALNGGLDREISKKSSPTGGFPWENYQSREVPIKYSSNYSWEVFPAMELITSGYHCFCWIGVQHRRVLLCISEIGNSS